MTIVKMEKCYKKCFLKIKIIQFVSYYVLKFTRNFPWSSSNFSNIYENKKYKKTREKKIGELKKAGEIFLKTFLHLAMFYIGNTV